ncbi:VMAP-C domain-containing protein [Actinorugispora endophytica]|uniref:VMAP-C domain-containing protein n=1 Tax=Actinorugispora endophytica TaxID=1605990 RepID=UPI001414EAF1|nr:trypsin-like peptidase domain-containing protein [Actinorugispora endophytica]
MPTTAETWRVRVLNRVGEAVGAGVLIDENRVLTCAHVVADALGAPSDGPRPHDVLRVDFLGRDPVRVECRVHEDGWYPILDLRGDLAVLELLAEPPYGAGPAALRRWDGAAPTRVRAFGHPAREPDGRWAHARTVASAGPGAEWVQLDGDGRNYQIDHGYSGAGVVDERTGEVIGVVVGRDLDPDRQVAWMIPLETVQLYWPRLRLGPAAPGPDRFPGSRSQVVPHHGLSEPAERLFVRELFGLDGVRDRGSRDLYVSLFEQRYPRRPAVPRHEEDHVDVRNLLRVCQSRPGGLHELRAILGTRHSKADLRALDRLIGDFFPDPLLRSEERNNLYELLSRVDPDILPRGLADEASGLLGPFLRADPGDLIAVAEELEEVTAARYDGIPPLLFLTARIGRILVDPPGPRIRAWTEHTAERLGVSRGSLLNAVAEADRGDARPSTRPWYYVTELDEDGAAPDHYLLTITLQHDTGQSRVVEADDVPHPLTEIPRRLEARLEEAPADVVRLGRPVIEFVLPRKLLNHPVDEWTIGSSNVEHRICIAYPVVVRSQERLRDPALRNAWLRKWEWVGRYGRIRDERSTHWVAGPGQEAPEALLTRLFNDERRVCLVVGHAPVVHADPARDLVRVGWQSGVPIMLWCRDVRDFADFRGQVQRLLRAGGLLDLPEQVHRLRNEAELAGDPDHLGRHLTLLWDDADRVEGPGPLRAPA